MDAEEENGEMSSMEKSVELWVQSFPKHNMNTDVRGSGAWCWGILVPVAVRDENACLVVPLPEHKHVH